MTPAPRAERPRIVIVGAGFGGLTAARHLRRARADVTVIDRTNHHVFQPLLYQSATASLAPSDITAPIRHVLRKQRNTTVLLGDVQAIDVERQVVRCRGGWEAAYDYLIVGAGTRHSYFGHPEWEALAPGLKTIEDAIEIRRRFLLAFERAELARVEDRPAHLTFVIVGAGPTGCELAGVMQEIACHAMQQDFRHIDTTRTRVLLIEGGPRVLATFPESLAAKADAELRELGVEVRTGTAVTRIEPDAVYVGDERIPARTVFWAAGNTASPLSRSLGVPLTRTGLVIVERDLSIPGHPNVFVIGDLAHTTNEDGTPNPGVAQVAIQAGRAAARNIEHLLRGEATKPFHYINKGDLATIGRAKAIANLFGGRMQVSGRPAWWLWLFIHIMYLVGFRNRISVLIQWAYAYATYQRGVRLITGRERYGGDVSYEPLAYAENAPESEALH